MPSTDLRAHVLGTLGPISAEWEETVDGRHLPFTIVRVDQRPVAGAVTFLTLGLSDLDLHFPSGRPARQELLFSCYRENADANVQGLLGAVALECAAHHRALARGEVQGPAGPILPSVELEALYASLPAYFPDGFATYRTTFPRTHFMWLIPVFRSEADFINRKGWSAFEDLLVRQNPDLLDLRRQELQLARIQLID